MYHFNFKPNKKLDITNCSRWICNAWHFYYVLRLVFKVVGGGVGNTLMRRYVPHEDLWN
ncbi:DUF3265 domain-containing protein [Vibrio sp. 070316B]|nr:MULTISPECIES: DUF3265 domain-containing protein [unclassified Vibrio]NOI41521.1 DUF3265 domain-containing protein [Vibrio sp. 070316B]NOI84834.1 DUF3265 domain-containing protein [Vibrio sp. 99K-1]